jgi:hypothetical protein
MASLYDTLPTARSIRLLRLHPGSDGERVSCSLEVVDNYASSPPYQALSYCWGESKDTTELTNNGKSFAVTKNLYAALHQLRQKEQSILVWADAICINQNNIAERNQQIVVMDMIYRNAVQVVIWLGPANQQTGAVMAMMRRILPYYKSPTDDPDHFVWFELSVAEFEITDFSREEWQSFWEFYGADWFFRVWVIQEVRHHKDIQLLCGRHTIDWSLVALATRPIWLSRRRVPIMYLEDLTLISHHGYENANFMWDRCLSTRRQAPFLALLDKARAFRASDSRDKVFGLLHHQVYQHVLDEQGQIMRRTMYPLQSEKVSNCDLPF